MAAHPQTGEGGPWKWDPKAKYPTNPLRRDPTETMDRIFSLCKDQKAVIDRFPNWYFSGIEWEHIGEPNTPSDRIEYRFHLRLGKKKSGKTRSGPLQYGKWGEGGPKWDFEPHIPDLDKLLDTPAPEDPRAGGKGKPKTGRRRRRKPTKYVTETTTWKRKTAKWAWSRAKKEFK